MITSFKDNLYSELTTGDSFLRTFFKVIKEGVKAQGIAGTFITGVLPITMDDLTSGFNIAEMVTLEPNLVNMLGFTYEETETYLQAIFDGYGFDKALLPEVRQIIRNNYDGYRFLPNANQLCNPSLITYFLKQLLNSNGTIPNKLTDENLDIDRNWIKRFTRDEEQTKSLFQQLINKGTIGYTPKLLKSKFIWEQSFLEEFFSIFLYYQGMITLTDKFYMQLPNNTMRTIFVNYE